MRAFGVDVDNHIRGLLLYLPLLLVQELLEGGQFLGLLLFGVLPGVLLPGAGQLLPGAGRLLSGVLLPGVLLPGVLFPGVGQISMTAASRQTLASSSWRALASPWCLLARC